jgi:arabinogalactan endo-1,4-beta-galactosidase
VQNGRGLGVFYWDATWTAVPGNGWDTKDPNSGNAWENQALFDFNDKALPALGEYLNP